MTHPGVIVVRGDEPGRKLVLDEVLSDFTLGADDGCHLVFKLRRVSPIHASLFLDDEGHVILTDALYANGFESALKQATDALADPEIVRPIITRCERFADRPDDFWKLADVTPALLACDPRPPELRR